MSEKMKTQLEALFYQYQNAVRDGAVDDVIALGKQYFSILRNGEMTETDREQLQNDILLCAARAKKD